MTLVILVFFKRKVLKITVTIGESTLQYKSHVTYIGHLGLSRSKLSTAGVELCFVYWAGVGLVNIKATVSLRFCWIKAKN